MYLPGCYLPQKELSKKEFRDNANDTLGQLLKCAIGLSLAKPEEIVKSCLTCDFFTEETEVCKKYNARPPARIIAFSCESYENISDEIPF